MKKFMLLAAAVLAACSGSDWQSEFEDACLDRFKASVETSPSVRMVNAETEKKYPTYRSCEKIGFSDAFKLNDCLERSAKDFELKVSQGLVSEDHSFIQDGQPVEYRSEITIEMVNVYNAPVRKTVTCYGYGIQGEPIPVPERISE